MKTAKFNIRTSSHVNSYLIYDGAYLKLVQDNTQYPGSPHRLYSDNIHTCRETFASGILRQELKRESDFYFGVVINSNPNISGYRKFLKVIENTLKIHKTLRVFPTSRTNPMIFVVKVSPWWLRSRVRQEFLTVLLRCWSMYYKKPSNRNKPFDPNNKEMVEAILFSHEYFARTKKAVHRFLDGGTLVKNKSGGMPGWLASFSGDKRNPEEVLVKSKIQNRRKDKGSLDYRESKPVALSEDDPNFSGASTI